MALETGIIEFPFAAGQNEGVDRAVLPIPQLSSLQNACYRKGRRLGKRNGYTSVSSLDVDDAALGNGIGRLACLGPSFCVVDDRFYRRDFQANEWQGPPQSFDTGALAGTRLYGKFPQFMPGPAYEVLNVQSDLNTGGIAGTANPSAGGMTTALGYVWTCASFFSEPDATWQIRVWATDPNTGDTVFQKDLDPGGGGTAPASVTQYPVLLSTGDGTVVLIYDHHTAGVKDGVRVRVLTSLAGGFSAEVAFACIESAANYDPSSSTGILFIYTLTGSPATATIARVNPATMVATSSINYATGGNKTLLSIFGLSNGLVWIGLTDASSGLIARAYDAALTGGATTSNWVTRFADAVGPLMFAERTSSSVCCVAGSSSASGRLNVQDIDSGASVSNRQSQFNAAAISQPFFVGGQVFIWARHVADAQLGVATLLRIPLHSEYANNNISPYVRAFPVEATLDDWDIDEPPAAGPSGPPLVTPRGQFHSAMGYTTLLQPTRASIVAGSTLLQKRFLLTQVRHRREGIRYSPSQVLPVAGKHFIPCAQPMWVDQGGEYEAGFIQAPVSTAATIITGGGSLTTNSNYSHTAIFESIDANGLIERSAPAVPRACATTANTTATVRFSQLEFGMRWVRCKIYRTLANGSVFYLVGSVDASPAMAVGGGELVFVDTYADTDIVQNEPLYTQVGQELAASQFPACSFAATGNGRMLCAGGFNANVGHFSKQFTARVCPEFCDDDAFRVRLEEPWTGVAYLDNWVAFTRHGIYVITGDGPDGSGNGFFSPPSRLPYALGCIDWRSVVTTEVGIFFQSARGLELLPRGFGAPVPMDQVEDTIEAYPIITSARAFYSSADGRQMVRWTAVAEEVATIGVVITYDLTFQSFSVDTYAADWPSCFQAEWEGEPVLAPAQTLIGANGASHWHPFRVQDTGFDDEGLPIAMSLVTGDVRPWGLFAHGVINRIGLFGAAKTACSLSVTTTTEHGTRAATKAYSGAEDIALDVALGKDTLRDVNFLRVAIAESSAVEGVTLTGLVVEHDKKNQGFRLLQASDRIT